MNISALKLLICLATFAVGAEDPNTAPVSSGLQDAAEKAGQLQRQMRMLQVSAMDSNSTLQSDSLKLWIDQIQTLKLPSEMVNAAVPAVNETKSPVAPEMGASIQTSPKKTDAKATSLAEIDMVKEPLNALAVADVLYRMGDYVRAMRFYDMVIAQKSDSNILPRQWAMYQVANCARRQDTDKAIELYSGLLAEYPNNAWASAALAQKQSLEWLKKNEAELKQRINVNDPNGR